MAEAMSGEQPRVKIVNPEHPHHGECGVFTGEVIEMRYIGGKMALVKLENCRHGGDACYVSPGDIREVGADDQFIDRPAMRTRVRRRGKR